MIVALEGVITRKEPTKCVVKLAHGVSYEVKISLFTSAQIQTGQKQEFLITQIIREEANLLFGFLQRAEQSIFEMLLKVSGIGALTALAVCSTLKPEQIQLAVLNADEALFKSVPGIGTKSARMIIAQLSDKEFQATQEANANQDAFLALASLGFKSEKITKVLAICEATSTEELVKEALKKITKI